MSAHETQATDATHHGHPLLAKFGIRVESESVIAAGISGVFGLAVGAVLFAQSSPPLWGDYSVGWIAAGVALLVGLVTGYVGYWRSRHLPGQRWRLELSSWKFITDATNVAAVHAAIAAIATVTVFIVLQQSFRGLVLDRASSAVGIGLSAGLVSYWIYLSVSAMHTRKMASLLVLYLTLSVLSCMATAQDPLWWEYHFSQLGTFGDRSSMLFNLTLIVAGGFLITFALYLHRDIAALYHIGVLARPWSARLVSIVFVVVGAMLAGVGIFPVSFSMILHNFFATGMTVAFALMLLCAPIIMKGMPLQFFLTTAGFLLLLVIAALLFAPIGYYNLTAFELIAFTTLFGWISVFIRFLAAVLEQARGKQAGQHPAVAAPGVAPVAEAATVHGEHTTGESP